MRFLRRATSSFLSGSLGAVSLTGSGVSNFYLQGKAASVALDLTGVSNAESAINSGDLTLVDLAPQPFELTVVQPGTPGHLLLCHTWHECIVHVASSGNCSTRCTKLLNILQYAQTALL